MIGRLFRVRLSVRSAFMLGLFVYLLDQGTKYLAKQSISPYEAIPVTSFFNFVYVENLGSAFGMFRNLGVYFFIGVAIVAAVIVSYLILKDSENRLAFGFVLGGALGNLTDRSCMARSSTFLISTWALSTGRLSMSPISDFVSVSGCCSSMPSFSRAKTESLRITDRFFLFFRLLFA